MWRSSGFLLGTYTVCDVYKRFAKLNKLFDFRLSADDSNLFHTFPPRLNLTDMDIVNMHLDEVTIGEKSGKETN